MPKLSLSSKSWIGVGGPTGPQIMEGLIYCTRERCQSSALLGESTRHTADLDLRSKHLWSPEAEKRAELEHRWQEYCDDRAATWEAAPLPTGWWITEASGGARRAYCSPRCVRLAVREFETE